MSNREVIERAFRQWRYESLREGRFPDCYRPHDVVEAVLMAWHLAMNPRRYQRWRAYWQRQKKLRYGGKSPEDQPRAPKGGQNVGGKQYQGGQFVPKDSPVIEIKGDELGAESHNPTELREKAWDYWKKNLQGKTFVNSQTGKQIRISRTGIRKLLHGATTQRWKALVIPRLPQIIEEARYLRSADAYKENAVYRKYHYFQINARVKSETMRLEMVVGEDHNGNWFYTLMRQREQKS